METCCTGVATPAQSRRCCGDVIETQGSSAFLKLRAISPRECTSGAFSVVSMLYGDRELQRVSCRGARALTAKFCRIGGGHLVYGEVSPCTDPLLVKGRRHILSFCRRMLRLGLAQATLRPVERVGIFTVWKKGRTTLRVILDARSNRLFRGPPPFALLTAEGLANIGLDFGDYNDAPRNVNLSLSVGDLQDFHCLKIDERYGRLFLCVHVRSHFAGRSLMR